VNQSITSCKIIYEWFTGGSVPRCVGYCSKVSMFKMHETSPLGPTEMLTALPRFLVLGSHVRSSEKFPKSF